MTMLRLASRAVRNFYLDLPSDGQIYFDERVAFLEYEENLPRAEAEYKTFTEMLKLRRAKYESL